MSEPVPLSKEDRIFSFGDEVDLSLNPPGYTAKKGTNDVHAQPPPADLGLPSAGGDHPKKGDSKKQARFGHYENIGPDNSENDDRLYSRLNYSPVSSVHPESSDAARERVSGYDSQQAPSDYELFLAKSVADYQNAQKRNWPTVEIDDGSFVRVKQGRHADIRKKLATLRGILRAVQVPVR
jgi:hypothetical protein